MSMEEKIWLYPELDADERREVDAYIRDHPELADTLRQSKALWRVLSSGGTIAEGRADEPPLTDEALAFLVVMGGVDRVRMPAGLRRAVDQLAERVEDDHELKRRHQAMLRRREELERASDVRAQVARLIGAPPENVPPESAPSSPRPLRSDREGSSSAKRRLRRVGWTVAGLAAVYLVLFVVGQLTRPAGERLAAFDRTDLVLEGYTDVRGDVPTQTISEPIEIYLDALAELRAARTSFIGLFPRFDPAGLDSAAADLRRVLALEPEESFLAGEARYLLAKTEIARGNQDAARSLLERTASMGGRRSTEAAQLLHEMEP